MDDEIIVRIGASVDGFVAGVKQAGASVEELKARFADLAVKADASGNAILAQAARFQAQGLSAQEASLALQGLDYSEKEAAEAAAAVASAAGIEAVALQEVTQAAIGTGTAVAGMSGRMGMARVEMAALTGSAGMAESGFARLAASSASLGPMIQAAFLPLAAVAVAGLVTRFVDSIVEAEVALDNLSKATSIPVATLAEFGKAAEASGAKSDDMTAAIRRLDTTISNAASGSKTAIETLHELGVEVESWHGIIPPTMTVLYQMADYMHLNAGNAEIMRAGMRALGTESVALGELLSKGSQGLKEYMQQFGEFGTAAQKHIQDAKDLEAIEASLGERWDVVKLQILGATDAILKYGVDSNPVLQGSHALMQGLVADWAYYKSAIELVTPFLDKYRDLTPAAPKPPAPPTFATQAGKAEKLDKSAELDADRADLKILEDKQAAGRAGLAGASGRVEQIRIEIGLLGEKQRIAERIAVEEAAEKNATPAQQAVAKKAVDEEYYYKRIELTKNLELAEREQEQSSEIELNQLVAKHREAPDAIQALQQFPFKLSTVDATAAVEKMGAAAAKVAKENEALAQEETAMSFSEAIKRDSKSIDEMSKRIEAEKQYAEAAGKLEDEVAIHALDVRQNTAQQTMRMQQELIGASVLGASEKARALANADIQELQAAKSVEAEKLKIIVDGLEDEKKALGDHAADLGAQKVVPESTEDFSLLAQWTKVQEQIVAKKQEAADKIASIDSQIALSNQRATDEIAKEWTKAANSMERSLQTATDAILTKSETSRMAWEKMAQSMTLSVIHSAEQQVFHIINAEALKLVAHVAGEHGQTAATATGALSRDSIEEIAFVKFGTREIAKVTVHGAKELEMVAQTVAGAIARDAAEIATHFATIARYAEEAAAGAYAAMAAIPIIGPALGAVAAVATFAAVMAFGSFEQGGLTGDRPMMAALHPQEMVLPSSIASPLQSMMPAIQTFNTSVEQQTFAQQPSSEKASAPVGPLQIMLPSTANLNPASIPVPAGGVSGAGGHAGAPGAPGAAGGSGSPGGATTQHFHFHGDIHNHGSDNSQMTEQSMAKMFKRATRNGRI